MKKLLVSVAVLVSLCALIFLSYTWVTGKGDPYAEELPQIPQEKSSTDGILPEEQELGDRKSEEPEESRERAAAGETKVENGVPRQVRHRTGYAYDTLPVDQKTLYDEILEGLENREQESDLSTVDETTLSKVFQCVINDHPEIFYVDGYTYTKYKTGNEITQITFHGNYIYDGEEIAERQEKIETLVDEIFEQMPVGMDDYGTVRYLYEYVIEHTQYQLDAPDSQNICSVFLNGESVCQGYAKALQYLVQEAGLEATLVLGYVENGDGHAWDLVKMDGDWYYVDPTWGDASYQMEEGSGEYEESDTPTMNYDYLGVTTGQLLVTHRIDNVVPMPVCDSMRDNYYVREGAYFTEIDTEQLQRLFDRAVQQDKAVVTLKCSDHQLYEQMKEYLLTKQNVFSYLDAKDGVLAYYDSSAQYTIGVWIP